MTINQLIGALLLALSAGTVAVAFPPVPSHTVYGLVRDELGNPLTSTATEIVLETTAGTVLSTTLVPGLDAAVNYRLEVPVDAGLTSDLYRPTALSPAAPFRMRVKIGGRIYVPIEMKASMARLGEPAQSSRVDLTLGEDTDGDGLPDAWERSMIAAGGLDLSLDQLGPGDHLNGNPLSVMQSYVAGTYAWDPEDGFMLAIRSVVGNSVSLEFVGLRGRSYTVVGSDDLQTWNPVRFRVAGAAPGPEVSFFQPASLRQVQIMVDAGQGATPPRYFKLLVQ